MTHRAAPISRLFDLPADTTRRSGTVNSGPVRGMVGLFTSQFTPAQNIVVGDRGTVGVSGLPKAALISAVRLRGLEPNPGPADQEFDALTS